MELMIAAFVFVIIVGLVVGLWWAAASRRAVGERLSQAARRAEPWMAVVQERPSESRHWRVLAQTGLYARLGTLAEQAGRTGPVSDVLFVIATFVVLSGMAGWFRSGVTEWALLSAVVGGSLPVFYLIYKRAQRLKRFTRQFPDALDMMARAIRAGYALAGGIQLVGEEMPDPVGEELRRVFEEIRLGLEPGEALEKLAERVPTDDVSFFCTAIRIQRTAGGNLAETLDRLSEVIRERFKLLSQARAISAQQRWGAIMIGCSPVALAVVLSLIRPGYFDDAIKHPMGPKLMLLGLGLEAIGFAIIWRIAKIKV